jgi:diguanylate cyclase (GGDEF)-like protein
MIATAKAKAALIGDTRAAIQPHLPSDRRLMCVAVFDMDKFTQYNNDHGTEAGDVLLARVEEDLRRSFSIVVRLAGDEFVAMFFPVDGADARRHLQAVVTTPLWQDDGFRITVSAGYALGELRRDDSATMLRVATAAVEAMLESKSMGGGQLTRMPSRQPPAAAKAGTHLERLLARIGFAAQPGCMCRERAAIMDVNGAAWCRANIDTIVGWMEEEASRRGVPFVRIAAKTLVLLAIRNAVKEAVGVQQHSHQSPQSTDRIQVTWGTADLRRCGLKN